MRLGVLLFVTFAFPPAADLRAQAAKLHPEQQRAVAEIEKAGGKVVIDAEGPDKPFTKVVLGGSSTDSVLVHLQALPNLQEVRFADFTTRLITDAGMEQFKALPRLRRLQLVGNISDAGIVPLKALAERVG
jgi:hypothetical protein